jgi:hypothetical protein
VERLESRETPSTGTVTQLISPLPNQGASVQGASTAILQSDGEVLLQRGLDGGAEVTNEFVHLMPDAQGNYAAGTSSAAQPMNLARAFYATNVLPNGNVFVLGGEFTGTDHQPSSAGEIYNPVSNTWASTPPFPIPPDPNATPYRYGFADDPTILLPATTDYPYGAILAGSRDDPRTYLYVLDSGSGSSPT